MFRIEKFGRAFLPIPKHKMTMWLVFEFIISMESWREFQPVLFRMHESVVSAWHIQDWRRVAQWECRELPPRKGMLERPLSSLRVALRFHGGRFPTVS